ncbi:hypothetical protein [Thioalkalivibrio sp. K90mix]|uniref:hypothetical protein n=1 Tax=Thioalkalivibrio sp. (strain K90mix) TaxID=396595 RepID=UPI0002DD6BCA|nr:hypothetical protein [Thioalkalivibrio sp. K90mix]
MKIWVRENDLTGTFIDNGDGQVLPARGGFTPRMDRDLAEEAAEYLGMDLEDIRTMARDDLVDLLKDRLWPPFRGE